MDIFIAYQHEDRSVAKRLATCLVHRGYNVWWDAQILSGQQFEDVIQQMLSESRAAVILWSRRSVRSDWVRAEAEAARVQGKAIPAVIDDLDLADLPLLFGAMHTADLRNWNGSTTHRGFADLLQGIESRVTPGLTELPQQGVTRPVAPERSLEAEMWMAIVGDAESDAEDYRAYLKLFGDGQFADLARARVAEQEALAARGGNQARAPEGMTAGPSDVFISYKRDRFPAAQHLAKTLSLHGFEVWFDRELRSGEEFKTQIEAHLEAARTVVVLWCAKSVLSPWVQHEARIARTLGKIIPVRIEDVEPPNEFAGLQTLNLAGWDGSPRSGSLDRLLDEIERKSKTELRVNLRALRDYDEAWSTFGRLPLSAMAERTVREPELT